MTVNTQGGLGFAWLSLIPGLMQGASGSAGTQSVLQFSAMQQAADKAKANQRTLIYIGGGLLAAATVGGVLYYVLKG